MDGGGVKSQHGIRGGTNKMARDFPTYLNSHLRSHLEGKRGVRRRVRAPFRVDIIEFSLIRLIYIEALRGFHYRLSQIGVIPKTEWKPWDDMQFRG